MEEYTPRCLDHHRLLPPAGNVGHGQLASARTTCLRTEMEGMLLCALCGAGADVHCAADAAFLCAACDAQVHGANFLVSRHRRTRVSAPKGLDDCDVSGTTLSSSCVYEADSATTIAMAPRRPKNNRRPARGQAVLQRWAKHMGITAPGVARQRAAAAARALLGVSAAVPRVPLRVAMAAALWREVAAAAHGSGVHDSADALRRLEACARVPARLVVATASAVGRGARVKRPLAVDTDEAWGECS